MAEVTLENVTKKFGKIVAVDDISLTVKDGQFLTLLGPSGCGKTTTLRVIAGLEKVTAGEVYFDGQPVTHLMANQRDIAMVFQSYAVYPHMNVYNNISFALHNMRVPKQEIGRRVSAVASILGLADLLARMPKELSGGQRQRVALGRAIVREAAVFLLDEPLSNLDAKLRVTMRGELKKLHERLGKTFVYVTHDQAEALTMSELIAVMNEGEILQLGTADEVYEQPADTFVAGFIGSPPMNLIEGRLGREAGQGFFQWGSVQYPLSAPLLERLGHLGGDSIILGVRPESVTVLRPEADAGVEASVYVREPLGADLFLTLELGGSLIKARVTPEAASRLGDRVKVHFDESKLRFFDPATGKAVPQAEADFPGPVRTGARSAPAVR